MRAYVIANPTAGRGKVGAGWERLLAELHRAGLDPVGDLAQGPGHAVDLARDARRDGRELVVAVGGDGTVHEVVNGLLADGPGPHAPNGLDADGPGPRVPMLGIVALGSGCDFVKTFDVPADVEGAVRRIASDTAPVSVDAGRLTCQDASGPRSVWFANIAEVGIGPEVVDRAARLPRAFGGAVYLAAFWLTLPRFRPRRATVKVDGVAFETEFTNLVIANGKAFGGGMRIAPDADPSDGRFDVQIHGGSKLDYVRGIAKVYRGTHLPHPRIRELSGETVEVTCEPEGLVEADGEVLGRTPARFEIVRGALRLKV